MLFQGFGDILHKYPLKVVELRILEGRISLALNSIFLAMIPKVNYTKTFDQFQSISLCNYFYKIISSIIGSQTKPLLSTHISRDQMTFLHLRDIEDAIGTT